MSFWTDTGDLLSGLLDLIPRLQIVRSNEFGVKFVKGKNAEVVLPGLFFYWPLVTEVELRTSAKCTAETQPQNLTTSDRITVIASSVMRYKILDIKKYLIDNDDSDDALMESLRASLKEVVSENKAEDLFNPSLDFEDDLKTRCQELASEFGVEIISARFSDFSETQSYTLHGIDLSNSFE